MPKERFGEDDSVLSELGTVDTVGALDSAIAGQGRSSETFDTPNDAGIGSMQMNGENIISGQVMLREMVKGQLAAFAAIIAAAVLFLGIFATAGIVPSMMEKGTIDLLLSKPLPRWVLLFGRALGGIAAIAINLAFFALSIWALYGFATGIWFFPFVVWTFAISIFSFLVLYSGVMFLNVVTESWVLPMSLAYVHMTIVSTILTNREATLFRFIESPPIRSLIDGLYYALPQVNDLITALPQAIFTSSGVSWEPLLQCTIFMIVMLSLAAWRFDRKDF